MSAYHIKIKVRFEKGAEATAVTSDMPYAGALQTAILDLGFDPSQFDIKIKIPGHAGRIPTVYSIFKKNNGDHVATAFVNLTEGSYSQAKKRLQDESKNRDQRSEA